MFSSSLPEVAEPMRCMEVWGGNCSVDQHLEMPGLELWLRSQTEKPVRGGGDVHFISSCASGRITRLALADVCGCPPVFERIACEFRSLVARNVNRIGHQRFVSSMNHELTTIADEGGFATALVVSYFAPTRSLTVCNAGHPPPLIYRQAEQRWSLLEERQPPSSSQSHSDGVVDHAEYQNLETRLAPGDSLACYSNSVAECEDLQGRTLGVSGLLQLANTFASKTPQTLMRVLAEVVTRNYEDRSQNDITLALFRATGTRPSWKQNLLAPFRLFGPVGDRTQIA